MKKHEDHPEGPEEISRRSFLTRSIMLLGALVGGTLGGSGLFYFLSPA